MREPRGWLALVALLAGCAQATPGSSGDPGTGAGSDAGSGAPDGGGLPSCGNGQLDAAEDCDDGNTDDRDACVGMCAMARCGDGFVRSGIEGCDDGNLVETDGCTTACVGWQYRAPITFEAATAGNNVPILVVLEPTSFAYAHAAADGSDLRFGTADNTSSFDVPHWLEAWNAAGKSSVWARVPSVVAGTNTVWIFYGHSAGAASTSDFAATFPNTLRTTANITLGGSISHDAVIVEAGHTVTVTAGAPLAISASYVRISGTLNAAAAGYAAAAGPGAGGTDGSSGSGGGGHGGAGGAGGYDGGDAPGAAGVANGAPSAESIDMGSGGGTGTGAGGRGGGAVRIDARRILVPGAIAARGADGAASTRSGGGGAGGGVLLRAASISFTGSIAVDAGRGGSTGSSANDGGGGGGGGRIKLLHRGEITDTGTATHAGGTGGSGGEANGGQPGSPGTKHTGATTTLPALPTVGAEQPID